MGIERVLALMLVVGVAHAEPDPRDIELHKLKGTVMQLERQRATCQDENRHIRESLEVAEQRLGLRRFSPKVLKPGNAATG